MKFQLQILTHTKKQILLDEVSDEQTVEHVLNILRSQHNIPNNHSLVLQFRELKPQRTLKSYLIGTNRRGTKLILSSFDRRDHLLEIEKKYQKKWEENRCFEADAPLNSNESQSKYMVTFPYPYMNGTLHVGHGFSLSKAEFMAGYQRLQGKKVLFPFSFHCTGMPIAACANKLAAEIKKFGNPPVFDVKNELNGTEEISKSKKEKNNGYKSKKGKEAKKKSASNLYQQEIMREMGIPESIIGEFADSLKWLEYFPPIAMQHLKRFGLKADFRRSFITTERNPYYNRFIEWQFNTLKRLGYVEFGKRMCIYSTIDGQPCADHDRAFGEGIQPQEYTLIKMKLLPDETPFTKVNGDVLSEWTKNSSYEIYMVAGTLRPETMYGQTNCFVKPSGDYILIRHNENELFICSEHSARNMAYQDLTHKRAHYEVLTTLKGWDLLGRKVISPNATFNHIYTLPLLTIRMDKATGIVTSVPSDSPDDYIAREDLSKDPSMQSKYFIEPHMISDYPLIPIIQIPGRSSTAALDACTQFKVKSQHDEKSLKLAKDDVYTRGFYQGRMLIGPFKGTLVSEAKTLIRADMIEKKKCALPYFEPFDEVKSRSGDICVVSNEDQWFLRYGFSPWKDQILKHLTECMELYSASNRSHFIDSINQLQQWACSRKFGLGTRLPFAREWIIESLSDSTIYMAFYTVSHILQNGVLDGHWDDKHKKVLHSNDKPLNHVIKPEDMIDEVWDYIFLGKEIDEKIDCKVSRSELELMRREFEYWYPFDLRVSGKDLIGNHLTMCLYNHAAIQQSDSSKQPRSFFTNGHTTINAEKMSKSTGNFMTLIESIEQFSADATRLALADAGDGLEDANFSGDTCNAAVLRLTKEENQILETWDSLHTLRTCEDDSLSFADRVFANDINRAVRDSNEAYSKMQFRSALNRGFYFLSSARNSYVMQCGKEGLHKKLIERYIKCLLLILSPICPHQCEYMQEKTFIGEKISSKSDLIVNQRWPDSKPEDVLLSRQALYIQENSHRLRVSLQNSKKQVKKSKKKSQKEQNSNKCIVDSVDIYVARQYSELRVEVLRILQQVSRQLQSNTEKFDEQILANISKLANEKFRANETLKSNIKEVMMFSSQIQSEMKVRGLNALELQLPFDELELVRSNIELITRGLDLVNVRVYDASQFPEKEIAVKNKAQPGKFATFFYSSNQNQSQN